MRLFAGFGALLFLALPATAQQKCARHRKRIKLARHPYTRAVSAFGALGKGGGRLFQDGQRARRINGPQGQSDLDR